MILDKIEKRSPETLDFTGFAGLKIQIEFLFYLGSFGEYISGGDSNRNITYRNQ